MVEARTSRAAADDATPATASGWRERLFVPTLVIIGSAMSLLSSLGAPLIPTIAATQHVSLSTGQWLLTSTTLVGSIASPIMGQLADGRRRRRVLIWSLVSVFAGCVLAASVDNFAALIAGRALQGVGLGLIPVAMVMARQHLPAARSASAIGILSVTVATGIGIGYPLTGLIAETFDYHAAFWAGAAIVAAALVLAVVVLPADTTGPPSHVDVVGASLFGLALVAGLTALSEGGIWGWHSAGVIGLLVASAVLGLATVRYELRVDRPLIVLAQLRVPVVVAADVCGCLIGLAMYLFVPIVVEFVQIPSRNGYGFGASVLVAGLCLVPLSAATAVSPPLMRVLSRRYGSRLTMIAAQVLFVAAMLFFAFRHAALWEAFLTMGLGGLGVGLSLGLMPGLIVASVAPSEVGAAMGLYQVVRNVGLTVGSAASAAILAINTGRGSALPFARGYRDALVAAAIVCLLIIPLTLLFPARNRSHESTPVSAGS